MNHTEKDELCLIYIVQKVIFSIKKKKIKGRHKINIVWVDEGQNFYFFLVFKRFY